MKIVGSLSSSYLPLWEIWRQGFVPGGDALEMLAWDTVAAKKLQESDISFSLEPITDQAKNRSQIWKGRFAFIQQRLATWGEVVHTDLDAFWLRDPLAVLPSIDADLVITKDRGIPKSNVIRWGFSLCCGFFSARSGRGTTRLFLRWQEALDALKDDQRALNALLLRQQVAWHRVEFPELGIGHRTEFTLDGVTVRVIALPLMTFSRTLPFCQRGMGIVAHPWFDRERFSAYLWLHRRILERFGRLDPWSPDVLVAPVFANYPWLCDHDRSLFWALQQIPDEWEHAEALVLLGAIWEKVQEVAEARTCYQKLLSFPEEKIENGWLLPLLRFAWRTGDRSLGITLLRRIKWSEMWWERGAKGLLRGFARLALDRYFTQ